MPSVADLRAARDILANHGGAGVRVALAIDEILNGDDPREALGLKSISGRSPLTIDRLERRDTELRAWRAHFHAEATTAEAARVMLADSAAYQRRLAAADRDIDEMPDSYRDTPRQHLWKLARMGAEMPGDRTLQGILTLRENAAGGGYSLHAEPRKVAA
jgi:hypothetical protein